MVKLCKRAEMNSEALHLLYCIFNVGGMQLLVSWAASAPTRTLGQNFLDFLKPYKTIYLIIIRTNWTLKIKTKTKVSIFRIPTLKESNRYQILGTCFTEKKKS